jgi:hypothetical protein
MGTLEEKRYFHTASPKELKELVHIAENVIDVARLEMSGERDGDGYWEGSDAFKGRLDELENWLKRYRRLSDAIGEALRAEVDHR